MRDTELGKPAKVVPKSAAKSKKAGAAAAAAGAGAAGEPDEEDEDDGGGGAGGGATVVGPGMMALYGLWQTDEYRPQGAVNGLVPKNNYGADPSARRQLQFVC